MPRNWVGIIYKLCLNVKIIEHVLTVLSRNSGYFTLSLKQCHSMSIENRLC